MARVGSKWHEPCPRGRVSRHVNVHIVVRPVVRRVAVVERVRGAGNAVSAAGAGEAARAVRVRLGRHERRDLGVAGARPGPLAPRRRRRRVVRRRAAHSRHPL